MLARRMGKGALLGTTLLASVAIAGSAWAADAAAPNNQLGELVVTGTRIPRPNVEQAQPVSVLTPQIMRNAGPALLGDMIDQLPAVTTNGSLRTNSNNLGGRVGAGVSAIDLRGLGVSRTLVLVDGQRHVAGDIFSGAVDVNTIPTGLVDHVEVLTGGASAIYGSDAVSGVVNIILKKNFQGLEADAQAGGYSHGFGAAYQVSASAGKNFLGDRLNVTGSFFYNKQNGIWVRDVPGTDNYGTIVNPADVGAGLDPSFFSSGAPIPNDGVADHIFAPHVGSELVTRNGVLFNPFTGQITAFNAAGQPIATPQRTGYKSFVYGQLPADCASCYFPDDYQQESSPVEIKGTEFRANMDFTTNLHGFVDAKFVQTDTSNAIQPSFSFGDFQLQPDNAFITPAIAQAASLSALPPQYYPVISKFINDGRFDEIRRRTWRIVAGLSGDFDARFAQVTWDGALNYGESDQRFAHHNLTILPNFSAALDSVIDPATGLPACRINVPSAPQTGIGAGAQPSCVPYNPFGRQNGAAAMAYSFGAFDTRDKLTQQVANLNAGFDTGRFFNLQGGPVAFAAGAEYRMERATEVNDAALNAGLTENLTADSSGGFNVYEGYVEVRVPIFKDFAPGLNDLSFDAAYRGAHYSTVKGVNAYRFTGEYGPLSWVKFRTTYSQAIRAPNITEAFTPASPSFFAVTDPCSAENIQSNVNFARNCAAAGIPAGFVANTAATIAGRTSGNRDLEPEKSISYTGGIALTPPVIPHLSVTFDYYSIKIKKAIYQLTGQDVINNCYGAASGLDAQYCGMLARGSNGNIGFVETTYLNSAKLFTDGYELQIDYRAGIAPLTQGWRYARRLDGDLAFSLTADYVRHLRYYPFQNNPEQVNVLEGTANASFGLNPQLKGIATLTYDQGPVTVSWQTRYLGRMALFSRDPSAVDHSEHLDVPFTPVELYHDLNVRYRLNGAARGTELFAGVRNLFDIRDPFTVTSSAYNQDTAFDLGRFVFVGARFRR